MAHAIRPEHHSDEYQAVDANSFEPLLRTVLDSAYGAALRLTRHPQDAEDLVQEASLRAFRAFASFTPGTNFKAWFYTILVNLWRSSARRPHRTCSLDAVDESTPLHLFIQTVEAGLHAPGSDPVAALMSTLASDDVAAALDELHDEFREVATLYFMEDFSYAEIARMLDVPVGTVRSRLHRARRILQRRLWQTAVDHGITGARKREEDA